MAQNVNNEENKDQKDYVNKYSKVNSVGSETLTVDRIFKEDPEEELMNYIIEMCGMETVEELEEEMDIDDLEKDRQELFMKKWKKFKKFAGRQVLITSINTGTDNGYCYFYEDSKTKCIMALVGCDEAQYAVNVAKNLDHLLDIFKKHTELCKNSAFYRKELGSFVDNLVFDVNKELGVEHYDNWRKVKPEESMTVSSVDLLYGVDPFTGVWPKRKDRED